MYEATRLDHPNQYPVKCMNCGVIDNLPIDGREIGKDTGWAMCLDVGWLCPTCITEGGYEELTQD